MLLEDAYQKRVEPASCTLAVMRETGVFAMQLEVVSRRTYPTTAAKTKTDQNSTQRWYCFRGEWMNRLETSLVLRDVVTAASVASNS